MLLVSTFGANAFAYVTCQQEALEAAKAMRRINQQSHARKVTDTTISEGGDKIEITFDSSSGGQSVTYEMTITGSDPCSISKVELIGEE